MKFGLDDKIIEDIQKVFQENWKIDSVVLFGSRAKGNYKEGSDIDLALKGRDITLDDLLSLSSKLDDLNLPYEIDLINYSTIRDEDVIDHIDRVGIVFSERWKECKLGELIEVKHGFAFSGEFISDIPTNNILVTPGNFNIGGGFKRQKLKYYKGNYPESYLLKEGDVVVTMTDLSQETDTLGYSAIIPKHDGVKFLHNQRIGLVNFISEEAEKDFIYWLMRTDEYHGFITGSSSGTSIMHTSPGRIKEYAFRLPPLTEQKMIANTLSSLDDKIELLQRQNNTLEQLAETLFRQWFVEEANDKREETTLYDSIILVGGGTPKTNVAEYWDGKIKWLSGGDIAENHKSFIMTTEKSITKEGLINSSARLLPKYATVISARGTVGKYCLLSEPMASSQSNYGIKPKYENCYFFTYLLIAYSVDELQSSAYGSVFNTITTKTFQEQVLLLPELEIIGQFEKEVTPYFQKMLNNQTRIQTLTQLRVALLPKLMSGDVRVKI